MDPTLKIYLCGALFTGSIVYTWINTDFPALLFSWLMDLGCWRGTYLPETLETWDRDEWADWSAAVFSYKTAHMLSCRGCFSVHASFWVSVGTAATAYLYTALGVEALLFIPTGTATYPILSCILCRLASD